jgi:hypothetical protein
MKPPLLRATCRSVSIFASIFLFAGPPLASEADGAEFFKKVKVKDDKVKVKAFGSKAKVKDKASGERKVKSKGPNRGLVASIARGAASRRDRAQARWFGRRGR